MLKLSKNKIDSKIKTDSQSYISNHEIIEINPQSYFEQLEPRIILGSCLALGGAEALLGSMVQASELDNPAMTAPPTEMQNPDTINERPAVEIPRLFSWNPSLNAFDELAKEGLLNKKQPQDWLNQPKGGADISAAQKAAPEIKTLKPRQGNEGYQRLSASLDQMLAVSKTGSLFSIPKAATTPQISIQPINFGNQGNTGSSGSEGLIVTPQTNSMVLKASGSLNAVSGGEYTISLAASGAGTESITNWTINWGDGTIDELVGQPDTASHIYEQEGAYIIKTSVTNTEGTSSASTVPVQVAAKGETDLVKDPSAKDGGEKEQPLAITSDPSQIAVVDREYRYQVEAQNLNGTELVYTLQKGPDGLSIDPATGLMRFSPSHSGTHTVEVQVTDGQSLVSQTFNIKVTESVPPQITSTPNKYATLGQPYEYQAQALDANGDALTWTLENQIQGMSVEPDSGRLVFNPTQAGAVAVTLVVKDAYGQESRQKFELLVRDPKTNATPVIHSKMQSNLEGGRNFSHQILASDPDGDSLSFTLVSGPDGLNLSSTGLVSWSPTSDQLGNHIIKIQVSDELGAVTKAEYEVTVVKDALNSPPVFTSAPPPLAAVSQNWTYRATAADPNNDSLYFALDEGPKGLTIDSVSGLFQWKPTKAQLGEHQVAIRVVDTYGTWAVQGFTIKVQNAKDSLRITSTPATVGTAGQPWVYQATVADAASDDLEFFLGADAPPTMQVDAKTGLVAFTSDVPGDFTVSLYARDASGAVTGQVFSTSISPMVAVAQPQISSEPPSYASPGKEYVYQVKAFDPYGKALSYDLGCTTSAPKGMTINQEGRVSWTPTANQLGDYRVEIIVSNGNAYVTQSYLLRVMYNSAPSFKEIADQTVLAGQEFTLDARANDPDKDALIYEVLKGPEGLTVDENGRLHWSTSIYDIGELNKRPYQVVLRAVDPFNEEAQVEFIINLVGDIIPPELNLTTSQQPANVGDTVSFFVQATDEIGVAGRSLTIDGQEIALNAQGQATTVFNSTGEHIVIARAWDAAGNISEQELILKVVNPGDKTAPVTSWNATNNMVVTDLKNITGSISDQSGVTWTLSLRKASSQITEIFASGEGNLSNGLLGTIDPSTWENGNYVLIFEAVDASGNKSSKAVRININSQYKMGNFNLSFQDMTINAGGIPITIQRTYDTLNSNIKGDFGYGWSLSYVTINLRDNTGADFKGDPFFGALDSDVAFNTNTKINLQLPDGRTAVFKANIYKINKILPYYSVSFIEETGTGATLGFDRVVNNLLYNYGELTNSTNMPFHPASEFTSTNYVLTTTDGLAYSINSQNGQCYQVKDKQGNVVKLAAGNITTYDKGNNIIAAVAIQRDAQNRITSITNNLTGEQVTYEYSAAGDLVAVNKEEAGGSVNLHYLNDPKAPPHYLKSITDARGVELLGVQYDFANGRIAGLTGPDGTSSSVSFTKNVGPGLNVETVTDPLGRTTETVVDQLGNPVRIIKYIPDTDNPSDLSKMSYQITIGQYDIKGNLLKTARPFTVTETELRAVGKNQYDYTPADLFWENQATYNAKNNMLTSTDAYGKITKYTYNTLGNVLTTTDPFGLVETNKYNTYGQLIENLDTDGNKSTYTYDGRGNVTILKVLKKDGSTETTAFEYNSAGDISMMTDEKGNITRYGLNAKGQQIFTQNEVKDAQDPNIIHKIISFAEYGENGKESKVWKEIDGLEISKIEYFYDEVGQLLKQVENGLSIEYIYDINGRKIETRHQTLDENNQKVFMVQRTVYDAAGQKIWEQAAHMEADPDNQPQAAKAIHIVYDSMGREVRREMRQNVAIAVTGTGINLSTVVKAKGELLDYSATAYNKAGKMLWTEDGSGVKTIYFYTPAGDLSHTVVDLDGDLSTLSDQYATSQTIYDDYGRELKKILDKDGNLTTTADQLVTIYTYNTKSELIKATYPDGTFNAYTYDTLGRKATETNQTGLTTYYEYNQNSDLTSVILPKAKHPVSGLMVHVRYEYTYNEAGKQTSLKDNIFQTNPLDKNTIDRSGQRETIFEYDWNDRQISRTLPDGSKEYFTYDAQDRHQLHVSFEGRVTAFEYDALDRVIKQIFYNSQTDFNQGQAAKTISHSYDVFGRVIKEVDSVNGTTQSIYNAEGQVSRISSPQGIINYEYDAQTGQVARTWTGNNSAAPITDVRNTYDKLGRLETVTTYAREGAALSNLETASYIYDIIGNLDKIVQANGVISDYIYDNLTRLKELVHYAPDATFDNLTDNAVLQRYTYDYYQDGNKSKETFIDAQGKTHTWAWVYDQLGRLTKEVHDNTDNSLDQTTEYVYDLVGNRLEKRVDKGNNSTIEEVVKGVFDQNDRLISETEIANGQSVKRTDYIYNRTEQIAKTIINLLNSKVETKTNLEYNAQGRLTKLNIDTYTNGIKTETITQEYSYNSSGIKVRQVEKIDANADGLIDSQSDTSYLNDALNHTGYSQVLEERRLENGQVVKVTTYTIGHDVLSQFDTTNGQLVILADGHGSTRALANALGQVVQEYNYDAYGNAIGFEAKNALTNLLYSGEQYNPVSGLQYLRARWYNPNNATFNRLDPFIGDPESPISFHNYGYTHMNPIMGTDPSGMFLSTIMLMLDMFQSLNMRTNHLKGNAPAVQLAQTSPQAFNAWIMALRSLGTVSRKGLSKQLNPTRIRKSISNAVKKRAAQIKKAARNLHILPILEPFYPEIYDHHASAMLLGFDILTYMFPGGTKWNAKNRADAHKEAITLGLIPLPGQSLDEYPYASTKEGGYKGGRKLSVRYLDDGQNKAHGGQLGQLYLRGLKRRINSKFLVILVPEFEI